MTQSHTTKILKETADYFVADLDNGGLRVGMFGVVALDVPAGHSLYSEIKTLANAEDFDAAAEAFIDSQVEAGRIDPRVF